MLQRQYKPFYTYNPQAKLPEVKNQSNHKLCYIFRGKDGYNDVAQEVMNALKKTQKDTLLCVSTDAHIAAINTEIASDKITGGPKQNWTWPNIRNEFIPRNKQAFEALIAADMPLIGMSDMFKETQFMTPFILAARNAGYQIRIVHITPDASSISQYAYMTRHIQNYQQADANVIEFATGDVNNPVLQIEQIQTKGDIKAILSDYATLVSQKNLTRNQSTLFAGTSQSTNDKTNEEYNSCSNVK